MTGRPNTDEYWRTGLPLGLARFELCDGSVREEYEQFTKQMMSDPVAFAQEVMRPADVSEKDWDELKRTPLSQLTSLAAAAFATFRRPKDLEDSILRKINDGALVAVGFLEPRKPIDRPALIPNDVWDGEIDWKESTVKGNGLSYVAVRINADVDEQSGHAGSKEPESPLRPQGRPSLKPYIDEAYVALKAEGQIDWSKSRARMYPAVKNWLCAQYPEMADKFSGTSDKTLAKYTRDRYHRDRAAAQKGEKSIKP